MKKALKPIFAGVFALLAFVSCDDKEETDNQQNEHDDAYYAAQASISSSDSNFTPSGDGGSIRFKTTGGSVVVNVDCGTDWTVDNTASDLFSTRANPTSGTLTISAGQNTVEEELTGTITVRTAKQYITFATITVAQSAYGAPEISVTANEWHFPAVGALTTEIGVSTTADKWEAVSSDRWVRVQTIDGGIELTASENEGIEGKTATVTVTASDGVRTETETIVVTQDGLAYAASERYKVAHSPEAGSVVCAVEANLDWDFTYDGQDSWYSVARSGDELTVTFKANDSGRRDGTITITVSDGAENVSDIEVAVTQYGTEAIILTYTIPTRNVVVYSPVSGDVSCEIDWGDGSDVETVKSANPSHTFAEAGEYTVCIDGTVTELNSSKIYSYESQNITLTAVNQWGNTGLTSMSHAFYDYTALKSLPEETGDSFADVTTFDNAFFYCPLLKTIPSDIFAKSTKVTDFSYTFYFCNGLEAIPAGLFDNCPEAVNFECIFYDCELVTSIPAGLFDNCTKATNFLGAFYCWYALEDVPAGLFSKNTEVEDFSYVFYGCTALKSIPDDLFANCTKVTSFLSAFYHNYLLESIPSTLFADCPKVRDFSFTFNSCYALTEIPSNLFEKCTEVEEFYAVFNNCTGLTTLPKGLFDSCGKATNFADAFRRCTALESIKEGLFDKCVSATDFGGLFEDCHLLESIPAGLFDNCPEVTDFMFAFYQCNAITEIPVGLFDKNTKVESFQSIFYEDSLIETIPDGLFDNCPEATDFQFAFRGCSLKSIPKGLFDNCPDVTTFSACFYNCTSLEEVPEGLFSNCTKITDFSYAFRGCSGLKKIPEDLLSNCTKITKFNYAFYNCTSWVGESPFSVINGDNVHLYERTSALGFSVPTETTGCFENDTELTDYARIPSSWGGGASTASIQSNTATVSGESPKSRESSLAGCMPFRK